MSDIFQISLTGKRHEEFLRLAEGLEKQNPRSSLSNQNIVSAAMQFALAAIERGDTIDFVVHDGRRRRETR